MRTRPCSSRIQRSSQRSGRRELTAFVVSRGLTCPSPTQDEPARCRWRRAPLRDGNLAATFASLALRSKLRRGAHRWMPSPLACGASFSRSSCRSWRRPRSRTYCRPSRDPLWILRDGSPTRSGPRSLEGELTDLQTNDVLRQHVSPHMRAGRIDLAIDDGTTHIGHGCASRHSAAVVGLTLPRPLHSVHVSSGSARASSQHRGQRTIVGGSRVSGEWSFGSCAEFESKKTSTPKVSSRGYSRQRSMRIGVTSPDNVAGMRPPVRGSP